MLNFWIPEYKFQLVEWFVGNKILTRPKANRMSYRQLLGKYVEIRKEK